MAKLPVVDDKERQRIRDALTHYKKRHGAIGDPELQQRIMYALGLTDAEMPLSTLQRFLRNKVRTEDRMVRRYERFLGAVRDAGFAEKLAAVIQGEILWPVYPPRWNVLDFEGRYEFAISFEEGESRKGQIVMVPSAAPDLLSVWYEYRDENPDASDWGAAFGPGRGAFLQSSTNHFSLVTPYMSAVSFVGLAVTESDPVTLDGTGLETGNAPGRPPGFYRMKMVKIQGPRLRLDKTPRDVDRQMTIAELEALNKK